MSNVIAAIGRGQMKHIDAHIQRKHEIYRTYVEGFADTPQIAMNPMNPEGEANNWFFCMTIAPGCPVTPEQVMDALAAQQMETRPIWKPMHLQPVFAGCDYIQAEPGPSVAEDIFARGLCLPSDIKMTQEDQQRVIRLVKRQFA